MDLEKDLKIGFFKLSSYQKLVWIIVNLNFKRNYSNFEHNYNNTRQNSFQNNDFETLCKTGRLDEAFNVFLKDQNQNYFFHLVQNCGKFRNNVVAKKIFEMIKQNQLNHLKLNTIHCNQLIQALGSSTKQIEDGLEIYNFMTSNKSIKPDSYTYPNLLKICIKSNNLEVIKRIHNDIIKYNIKMNIYITSSLITCYSNCGDLESAFNVFKNSKEREYCYL